ncbi:hypothetical protein [Nonomuraea jiangxiensis]|uniref:DUF4166 domain-containing protein n=1 Tax=Nonomuraea jiangxiensis TaxID=633440 RepID=A0A1G7ZJU8_9ACTN|nr:hypothetical protein [Nonomuraea jiangxiensis]SDH08847.1 hypothetical protein SAMN05421869_101434 [Nonomuraea jiangxiensis]
MGFGVREFELALLHRMRDLNAERVEVALGELGASRAEVRAAHAHWTRILHASRGRAGLGRVLGRPAHRDVTVIGSLTCDVARWELPSWPGLQFEVLYGPGREVWNQWFVRPGGAARLAFADLAPWGCVVGDVAASFPGAAQLEGTAPHHWAVEFRHGGTGYRARFVYGLYQRLDRLPAESADGGPHQEARPAR